MLYDPILLPELDPAITALLNAAAQVTYRLSGTIDASRSFQLPAGAQSLLILGAENYAYLQPLVDYETIGSTVNFLNTELPTGAKYWGVAVRSSLADNTGAQLPSQLGHDGKFLKTDGVQHSWQFATQNAMTPGSNSVAPTVNAVQIALNAIEAEIATNTASAASTQAALLLKADLVGGKVPASQLPSYVDDVVEAASFAALPIASAAETGKIYVTTDDNQAYRWSGSVYVQISKSELSPYKYYGNPADNNISRGLVEATNTIDASSTSNTFNDGFSNNQIGSVCLSNVFGENHVSNSYGTNVTYCNYGPQHFQNNYSFNHVNNRYGYDHVSNSYAEDHRDNCYGSSLSYNTFGYGHYYNTYGSYYNSNVLGGNHEGNRYGNYTSGCSIYDSHFDNVYGRDHNGCTYATQHGSNRYAQSQYYNTYGNSHFNNLYGANHTGNNYGDVHSNNRYGNHHYYNHYESGHYNNVFGDNHNSNSYGYGMRDCVIGNDCSNIYIDDNCERVHVYNCSGIYIPANSKDVSYVNNQLVVVTVEGIDIYNVPLAIRTDVVLGTFNSSNELTSTITQGSLAGMSFSYQTYTYTYMPGDGGGLVWVRNAKQSASTVGGINASQLEEVRTTARLAPVQSGDYTMQLSDAGGVVPFAQPANFYIPAHVDVPMPIGAIVEIAQEGTGAVTVVGLGGVVLHTAGGYSTNGQWNSIGIRQRAIDEWVITNGI